MVPHKGLFAVIRANWSASYSSALEIRLPVLMSHQNTEKCDQQSSTNASIRNEIVFPRVQQLF